MRAAVRKMSFRCGNASMSKRSARGLSRDRAAAARGDPSDIVAPIASKLAIRCKMSRYDSFIPVSAYYFRGAARERTAPRKQVLSADWRRKPGFTEEDFGPGAIDLD